MSDEDRITYNLEQKVMVDFDGQVYPIVTMYDEYGEETEDTSECMAFIAGREGYWVAVATDEADRIFGVA